MTARRVNPLLADALRYALRNWPVHPLDGKRPIVKGWRDAASTDEEQLRAWWAEFPEANIGLVGGLRSKLLILDVDNKEDKRGDATLQDLEETLGALPETRTAETPHGRHYYFDHPRVDVKNSVGFLGLGIDIRAEGGYVVAPRSQVGGRPYRWINELEPVPLPDLWLEELRPKPARELIVVEGERNDTAFREACRLRGRNIPNEEAWEQLLQFNELLCKPPLDERELRRCFESAWKYPAGHQPNDLGNAQRFVERYGQDVRYVVELRQYILWENCRWRHDPDDLEVVALMKQSNRFIWDEARDTSEESRQRKLAQFATTSQNTARLRAAVESVKSEPGVKVTVHALDADPLLLGVRNGVIDLTSGEWRRAERDDLVTKLAGCDYVGNAKCPTWLRFLDRVMNGDADVIEYLQRLVGYSLTGLTTEQILLFVYGAGANGKTVFLETIKEALGDYGRNLRTDALASRGFANKSGPTEDEARLVGARFVTVNETTDGMRFNEALIKDMTGGDTITARRLYENSFEYRPQFKLWIRGNHKPLFNGDDGGMARRIKLIPFDVRIPDGERDPRLSQRLREELPGILNWAIGGCLKWRAKGLGEPEAVKDATSAYLGEMDTFGGFLDDCCEVEARAEETASTLYLAYRWWCHQNGYRALPNRRFGQKLAERGFTSLRARGGGDGKLARRWRGLCVRFDAHPPPNWRGQ